jgi:hypothetical protein
MLRSPEIVANLEGHVSDIEDGDFQDDMEEVLWTLFVHALTYRV